LVPGEPRRMKGPRGRHLHAHLTGVEDWDLARYRPETWKREQRVTESRKWGPFQKKNSEKTSQGTNSRPLSRPCDGGRVGAASHYVEAHPGISLTPLSDRRREDEKCHVKIRVLEAGENSLSSLRKFSRTGGDRKVKWEKDRKTREGLGIADDDEGTGLFIAAGGTLGTDRESQGLSWCQLSVYVLGVKNEGETIEHHRKGLGETLRSFTGKGGSPAERGEIIGNS